MTTTLHRSALRVLVAVAGVSALAIWVFAVTNVSDVPTVLQLCAVALAASTLRFPHGPASGATLASIVIMSVYVIAGPAAAVVVAGVGALMQPRNVPMIKRIYNSSQRILSAAGGAAGFVLFDGPTGDAVLGHAGQTIVAVTAAGLVHQVVNAVLMCLVLSLERGAKVVISFFREVVAPIALPM